MPGPSKEAGWLAGRGWAVQWQSTAACQDYGRYLVGTTSKELGRYLVSQHSFNPPDWRNPSPQTVVTTRPDGNNPDLRRNSTQVSAEYHYR